MVLYWFLMLLGAVGAVVAIVKGDVLSIFDAGGRTNVTRPAAYRGLVLAGLAWLAATLFGPLSLLTLVAFSLGILSLVIAVILPGRGLADWVVIGIAAFILLAGICTRSFGDDAIRAVGPLYGLEMAVPNPEAASQETAPNPEAASQETAPNPEAASQETAPNLEAASLTGLSQTEVSTSILELTDGATAEANIGDVVVGDCIIDGVSVWNFPKGNVEDQGEVTLIEKPVQVQCLWWGELHRAPVDTSILALREQVAGCGHETGCQTVALHTLDAEGVWSHSVFAFDN